MTITSQGYKGKVDELNWARIASSEAGWVESKTDLAVAAVGGVRQVTVAAGAATQSGVRVASDAVTTSPVFPTPSNGQWYLAAIDRNWDPSTRASSIVFLTGPAAGSPAAPAVIPSALPTPFYKTPGVRSYQALCWIFVSSSSTTLTLFDLRMVPDGAGAALALSFAAAQFRGVIGALSSGSRLAVANDTSEYRWDGSSLVPILGFGGWAPGFGGDSNAYLGDNGGSDGYLSFVGKSTRYDGRLAFGSSAVFGGAVVVNFNATGAHDPSHTTGYGTLIRGGYPDAPIRLKPTGDGFGMFMLWEQGDGVLVPANQLGSIPTSSVFIFHVDAVSV